MDELETGWAARRQELLLHKSVNASEGKYGEARQQVQDFATTCADGWSAYPGEPGKMMVWKPGLRGAAAAR